MRPSQSGSRAARVVSACAGFAFILCAAVAHAQGFPTKPIRIIVAAPPGGGQDNLVRLLTTNVGRDLGQAVVAENRGAASGIVASELVAKSPPDGYTLLLGSSATYVVNTATFATLPYDPVKDFAPISLLSTQPFLLAVNNSVAATSIPELVALAKAQPGKLNYATTGAVTVLAMSFLNSSTGIKMQAVPYQGLGQAIPDVIGGRVEVLLGSLATVLQQVRSGRLRAVGLTALQRSPMANDIPTIAEQGVPGYEVSVWTGLAAPASTPAAIINRLNAAVVKVLTSPETAETLIKLGIEPAPSTPQELAQRIQTEGARWQRVAKEAGVTPQ